MSVDFPTDDESHSEACKFIQDSPGSLPSNPLGQSAAALAVASRLQSPMLCSVRGIDRF